MKDRIECARVVFADLIEESNKITSPTADVTWSFDEGDAQKLGLSTEELRAAEGILLHKGLLRRAGMNEYRLSEAGHEVCLHPHLLDDHLAPRPALLPAQNVTINAENMQNTQVGHHNTQNVTYSTVLESLRQKVEAADATGEDKQSAKDLIDKLLRHPLASTIVNLTIAGLSTGMR